MTSGRLPFLGVLGVGAMLLGGCTSAGPFVSERSLGSEKSVITDARTRLTNVSVPMNTEGASVHGRVVPARIVCAEPSPDVATTLSQAITASFSAAGEGKGISAAAAGQFGKSLSEGLVQMTERTATLQLLRDSLHRACEAYANGALSDVSYSLLMSRYDELMVTLLTGELTANALGRKLATISGEASHVAGLVQQDVQEKLDALDAADKDVTLKQTSVENASSAEVDQKKRTEAVHLDPASTKEQKDTATTDLQMAQQKTNNERDNLNAAKRKVTRARLDLSAAEMGAQSGFAKTSATAVGGLNNKVTPQLADRLVTLHDRFMQPSNRGLFISCVTVLDRPDSERPAPQTHMMEICKEVMQEFRRGLRMSYDARAIATADIGLATLGQTQDHQLKIAQTVSAAAETMATQCKEGNAEGAKGCMESLEKVVRALTGTREQSASASDPQQGAPGSKPPEAPKGKPQPPGTAKPAPAPTPAAPAAPAAPAPARDPLQQPPLTSLVPPMSVVPRLPVSSLPLPVARLAPSN